MIRKIFEIQVIEGHSSINTIPKDSCKDLFSGIHAVKTSLRWSVFITQGHEVNSKSLYIFL